MSYADHDHHGDYAESRHNHDYDYAEKYHRHYDDESTAEGLREDLNRALERISDLQYELNTAFNRIESLEEARTDG